MPTKFKVPAIAAVVTAAAPSVAMARYCCVQGYTYRHGICQPVRHLGYHNPVSGEAAGAAQGNASGGPVGAVVGGAVGTASGALTGTANMLEGR
jgi:hypothetical protein